MLKSAKYSIYKITQNISLVTSQRVILTKNNNDIPTVQLEKNRPMVVLLEYMNAKKKHIQKICDVYLNWNYDVLQIELKPLQLLYPLRGSQVVARNVADFLEKNKSFSPLIIHGFSVGGYLWGEVLVHFKRNLNIYQPVLDRIQAQIFDSPADFECIPTAFPYSLFPHRPLVRAMFAGYISYHLKFNYQTATKHYTLSRQTFTSEIVKAPTLLIASNVDSLSPSASILKVRDEFAQQNVQCRVKLFEDSSHVMHFAKYPKEYISEIKDFLTDIGQDGLNEIKSKL